MQKKGLIKIAKPVGVIGALTPVTNCEATLPAKALPALKGRNAIIFAPHPKAKKTAKLVCESTRKGLQKIGAPLDLIQLIEEPSIEMAQELMKEKWIWLSQQAVAQWSRLPIPAVRLLMAWALAMQWSLWMKLPT